MSGFKTAVCELLGIEVPIVLAGMGGVAGPELAAAVSNAGGLGVLGASRCDGSQLDDWVKRTRRLTDKPFGVDTLLPSRRNPVGSVEEASALVPHEYRDLHLLVCCLA